MTSTITISGSIGGRKINFTHTYTLENVYDIGTRIASRENRDAQFVANSSGAVYGYLQDTPSLILLRNDSRQSMCSFTLTNAADPLVVHVYPRSFTLLHSTSGTYNLTNASGSTTLTDVTDIITDTGINGLPIGVPVVFLAFNAAS